MEFPSEIHQYILSFLPLPHIYKQTLHVKAINTTALFADFTIDRLITMELDTETNEDHIWLNSYVQYKRWRNQVRGLHH